MVAAAAGGSLHPLEQTLHALLAQGKVPSVNDLGGMEAIAQSVSSVAASPIAAEILATILRSLSEAGGDDALVWKEPIGTLVQGAMVDTVLIEMIDATDACEHLPQLVIEDVFMAFLQKATNTSGAISAYARAIALEGAFRLALTSRRRQLRLLDMLLSITAADEPQYLQYAAKILGIAHSHWREGEIVKETLNK